MADIAETPEYLSVPVVFTKEGVHNRLLKRFEGFKNVAQKLVGKPVVIGHPAQKRPVDVNRDPVTGEVESCEARETDKTLHGRIKILKEKAPEWLLKAVREGTLRGGSLGYWSVTEPFGGFYKGKFYSGVETVTDVDHYAIGLPDGAASVRDGVGLRFNSKEDGEDEVPTLSRIRQVLTEIVNKKEGKHEMSEDTQKFETKIKTLKEEIEKISKVLDEEKKLREKAEGDLKVYREAEAKAEQDKKEGLIRDIIKDTEDKPEMYKDWTVKQLETLKNKLQSATSQQQAKADNKAVKPPTQQTQGSTSGFSNVPLTIGNSLFGKRIGEK